MEEKKRCQSCGMPLGAGFYGTEADGKENHEYCKYCYEKGAFTMPGLTVAEAVKASVDYMVHNLKMEEEQAEVMSHAVIPSLKRWRNSK
jgi:hypothetical protein